MYDGLVIIVIDRVPKIRFSGSTCKLKKILVYLKLALDLVLFSLHFQKPKPIQGMLRVGPDPSLLLMLLLLLLSTRPSKRPQYYSYILCKKTLSFNSFWTFCCRRPPSTTLWQVYRKISTFNTVACQCSDRKGCRSRFRKKKNQRKHRNYTSTMNNLDVFFRQIKLFIRFHLAFVFRLQTLNR